MEDVERTNGRLMVRVEEMERQVALMQDRVESNRIVLQRHGYLRQRGDSYAQAPRQQERQERPGPAPQSHYPHQGDYQADPSMNQRIQRRGGASIPLSNQQSGHSDYQEPVTTPEEIEIHQPETEGDEIVITNEKLERYFGSSSSSSSQRASSSSSTSSSSSSRPSGSTAQAPVTSERLPTTEELGASRQNEAPAKSAESSSNLSQRELLDLYQDSLSKYRGGDYGEALQGFTRFLQAGPREDYVDNALYWIGECHYGLGQYERSISFFQQIIDELQGATKVPDAMLKMSLAYDQIGQPQRAVQLLEELTEKYPRSNPGRLGAERLQEHSHYDGE